MSTAHHHESPPPKKQKQTRKLRPMPPKYIKTLVYRTATLPGSLNALIREFIYLDVLACEPSVEYMRTHVLPLVAVQYDLFCIVREKQKMMRRMNRPLPALNIRLL